MLDLDIISLIGWFIYRWTCRNCSIASNMTSSNLRPCDFKMGKVLSSLQRFRCSYNFNIRYMRDRKIYWYSLVFSYILITIHLKFKLHHNFYRLPVSRKSMSHIRILSDVLQRGISVIARELRGAKALVDGKLVRTYLIQALVKKRSNVLDLTWFFKIGNLSTLLWFIALEPLLLKNYRLLRMRHAHPMVFTTLNYFFLSWETHR